MVSNAQLKTQLDAFIARMDANHTNISAKIDGLCDRLDKFETRIDKLEENYVATENRIGNVDATLANSNELMLKKFADMEKRIKDLEDKLETMNNVPEEIKQLAENVEDRTNRQLRETLIFKNIPEEPGATEDYKDTKELLAATISDNCDGISYDFALQQIKRAHRESDHRRTDDGEQLRLGKRHIYAAFHSWDLCQTILESFREENIADQNFPIQAEQKYGPKTSKRRQLAFQLRRQLIDNGTITSGFVQFPAKLMVNLPGNNGPNGKKIYTAHTNFSKHVV